MGEHEEDVLIRLVRLEEKLKALKDEMDSTVESTEVALKLKAIEIERRLESLNGEAGRIANVLEKSVPRELFESKFGEIYNRFDEKLNTVNSHIVANELDMSKKISLLLSKEVYEPNHKALIDKINILELHLNSKLSLYTPRDTYESSFRDISDRVAKLEQDAKEQKGKLWLPLLFVGALVVGSVTVLLRYVIPL